MLNSQQLTNLAQFWSEKGGYDKVALKLLRHKYPDTPVFSKKQEYDCARKLELIATGEWAISKRYFKDVAEALGYKAARLMEIISSTPNAASFHGSLGVFRPWTADELLDSNGGLNLHLYYLTRVHELVWIYTQRRFEKDKSGTLYTLGAVRQLTGERDYHIWAYLVDEMLVLASKRVMKDGRPGREQSAISLYYDFASDNRDSPIFWGIILNEDPHRVPGLGAAIGSSEPLFDSKPGIQPPHIAERLCKLWKSEKSMLSRVESILL